MSLYWPILLMVGSDIFYQICAKSTPTTLDPLAGLTITYCVSAAVSAALFFILSRGGNIVHEWSNVNWTTFILGLSLVGLEFGSIMMYKAGWNINTGYIVKSIILAIALIFVGYLFYKEQITGTKIAGIAICLVGLYLLNK